MKELQTNVVVSEDEKRRKKLYNLLKRMGNHFTLQQTVANLLPKFYPYDSAYSFHDSTARICMTKDIQAINNSSDYEKIIISSPQGIKLSTKREFDEYIKSQYTSVWAKYNRTRKKELKAKRDGQSVMGDGIFTIDHIVESFISEEE